jgi:hypothetical protein
MQCLADSLRQSAMAFLMRKINVHDRKEFLGQLFGCQIYQEHFNVELIRLSIYLGFYLVCRAGIAQLV